MINMLLFEGIGHKSKYILIYFVLIKRSEQIFTSAMIPVLELTHLLYLSSNLCS